MECKLFIVNLFDSISSDTYGWDQSEKFVKIYVTSLGDTSKVSESDVVSNFTEK